MYTNNFFVQIFPSFGSRGKVEQWWELWSVNRGWTLFRSHSRLSIMGSPVSMYHCRYTEKWCGTIKAVRNTDHTRHIWIHRQTPLSSLAGCGPVGEGMIGKVLNWTVHSLNDLYQHHHQFGSMIKKISQNNLFTLFCPAAFNKLNDLWQYISLSPTMAIALKLLYSKY